MAVSGSTLPGEEVRILTVAVGIHPEGIRPVDIHPGGNHPGDNPLEGSHPGGSLPVDNHPEVERQILRVGAAVHTDSHLRIPGREVQTQSKGVGLMRFQS